MQRQVARPDIRASDPARGSNVETVGVAERCVLVGGGQRHRGHIVRRIGKCDRAGAGGGRPQRVGNNRRALGQVAVGPSAEARRTARGQASRVDRANRKTIGVEVINTRRVPRNRRNRVRGVGQGIGPARTKQFKPGRRDSLRLGDGRTGIQRGVSSPAVDAILPVNRANRKTGIIPERDRIATGPRCHSRHGVGIGAQRHDAFGVDLEVANGDRPGPGLRNAGTGDQRQVGRAIRSNSSGSDRNRARRPAANPHRRRSNLVKLGIRQFERICRSIGRRTQINQPRRRHRGQRYDIGTGVNRRVQRHPVGVEGQVAAAGDRIGDRDRRIGRRRGQGTAAHRQSGGVDRANRETVRIDIGQARSGACQCRDIVGRPAQREIIAAEQFQPGCGDILALRDRPTGIQRQIARPDVGAIDAARRADVKAVGIAERRRLVGGGQRQRRHIVRRIGQRDRAGAGRRRPERVGNDSGALGQVAPGSQTCRTRRRQARRVDRANRQAIRIEVINTPRIPGNRRDRITCIIERVRARSSQQFQPRRRDRTGLRHCTARLQRQVACSDIGRSNRKAVGVAEARRLVRRRQRHRRHVIGAVGERDRTGPASRNSQGRGADRLIGSAALADNTARRDLGIAASGDAIGCTGSTNRDTARVGVGHFTSRRRQCCDVIIGIGQRERPARAGQFQIGRNDPDRLRHDIAAAGEQRQRPRPKIGCRHSVNAGEVEAAVVAELDRRSTGR